MVLGWKNKKKEDGFLEKVSNFYKTTLGAVHKPSWQPGLTSCVDTFTRGCSQLRWQDEGGRGFTLCQRFVNGGG